MAEIRFTEAEHANHAIDAMDGAYFGGVVIRLSWSPKSRPLGMHVEDNMPGELAGRKVSRQSANLTPENNRPKPALYLLAGTA